jgi:hypothetical protein
MIRHRCPECGELLVNSPSAAGLTITCPHCRSPVEVPPEGTVARGEVARVPAGMEALPESDRAEESVLDRIGGVVGAHTADGPPGPLTARKRIVLGVFGLVLAALFGGMFVWAVSEFAACRASRNWPSAPGQVEGAGVLEEISRTRRGRERVEYSTVVRYKYAVQGRDHTGARVGFGPSQSYSFLASELAGQYRPGQPVTVYYDPADPKNAVLRREVLFGGYVYGFVGLFGGFWGVRLLLVSVTPTTRTADSRWLPWSRRVTWPDLPLVVLGVIGVVLWVPMLFGL